ncbi:MAG: biotin--[Clostridia bacterium]|nr:biotin--[acetyl-CoA-carboxylase] ligase [Clostridia bacterium]
GYVLAPTNTRLCGEQLRGAVGENLFFFEETDSTNNDIKRLAEAGDEFAVATARVQTGGRGRLGRSFLSPEGGLYFSVLLKPKHPAEVCLKITTAAAVAAARAIEKVCMKPAQIKWVNDIYIKDKKVCGILTEGVFDAESGQLKYAVLGVGINVSPPKGGFSAEIADKAGSLFDGAAPSLAYCALLSEFLNLFKQYYADIESMPHIEEYRRRSYLDGRKITYRKDGKTHSAEVAGVGENAELIVKEKGKTVALTSGEVEIAL